MCVIYYQAVPCGVSLPGGSSACGRVVNELSCYCATFVGVLYKNCYVFFLLGLSSYIVFVNNNSSDPGKIRELTVSKTIWSSWQLKLMRKMWPFIRRLEEVKVLEIICSVSADSKKLFAFFVCIKFIALLADWNFEDFYYW